MNLLTSLRAAFKGGAPARVPLARNFVSPWQLTYERGGTRLPYEYRTAVRHASVRRTPSPPSSGRSSWAPTGSSSTSTRAATAW